MMQINDKGELMDDTDIRHWLDDKYKEDFIPFIIAYLEELGNKIVDNGESK